MKMVSLHCNGLFYLNVYKQEAMCCPSQQPSFNCNHTCMQHYSTCTYIHVGRVHIHAGLHTCGLGSGNLFSYSNLRAWK